MSTHHRRQPVDKCPALSIQVLIPRSMSSLAPVSIVVTDIVFVGVWMGHHVSIPSCQWIWQCRAKTEGNGHQPRRSAPAYGYWMGLLAARRQGRKDEGMVKIPPPGGGGHGYVEVFKERRLSSRFPVPCAQEPAGLNDHAHVEVGRKAVTRQAPLAGGSGELVVVKGWRVH